MAARISRLYFVLPSGPRVGRWPESARHLQIWPGNLKVTVQPLGPRYRHGYTFPLRPQAHNSCVSHLDYAARQQVDLARQCRNYSSESGPKDSNTGSSAAPTETSTGGPGGGAPAGKAVSSTERIKIILKEYGTVAVVFHTSMSLCVLGICYLLVSK